MTKQFGGLLVAGALSLALIAAGCKKDEETNPIVPGGGGGTLGQATCQIDGAARTFIGIAVVDTSGDRLSGMFLGGFSAAAGDTITIEMFINNSNPANGSTFSFADPNYAGLYYTNGGATYLTGTGAGGTLGVGTNGATAITGTFSFTARQVEGTATKSVTGGTFNFPKVVGAAEDGPALLREFRRARGLR